MASVLARQSLGLILVSTAVSVTAAQHHQQLHAHVGVARDLLRGEFGDAEHHGFRAHAGAVGGRAGAVGVVGPRLGPYPLCTSTDSSVNDFKCVTGGPVTLAEFTLGGSGGMDLYDVSVVDGFNLPVTVAPQLQGGNYCAPTGCIVDMNGVGACPPELQVTSSGSGTGVAVVRCKSACQAFGSAEYCCTGEYGNPNTCKPSAYSELFKKACPLAVSYAYDYGADSIFTCDGGGGDTAYAITFCSSTISSGKLSSSPNSQPPSGTRNLSHIDSTTPTPWTGGSCQVIGAATPPWHNAVAVLGLVSAVLCLVNALVQFWGQAAAAAAA